MKSEEEILKDYFNFKRPFKKNDNLSRNDEIGIYYNPMGNLYYERIGDEDNE